MTAKHTMRTMLVILFLGVGAYAQQPNPEDKTRVLADYQFRVLLKAEDTEIGTYTVKAVENLQAKTIQIDVALTGKFRKRKIRIESQVTYTNGATPQPIKGSALTAMNGNTLMTGEIWFSQSTYGWACKKLFDPRKNKKVDPPAAYGKKNQSRPKGTILFQSAALILGPGILTTDGQKKITFVEFPDDLQAPELVTFKSSLALQRKKTQAGGYELVIREPADPIHSRQAGRDVWRALFDKDNQPIEISLGGKLRLVPAKTKEQDKQSEVSGE